MSDNVLVSLDPDGEIHIEADDLAAFMKQFRTIRLQSDAPDKVRNGEPGQTWTEYLALLQLAVIRGKSSFIKKISPNSYDAIAIFSDSLTLDAEIHRLLRLYSRKDGRIQEWYKEELAPILNIFDRSPALEILFITHFFFESSFSDWVDLAAPSPIYERLRTSLTEADRVHLQLNSLVLSSAISSGVLSKDRLEELIDERASLMYIVSATDETIQNQLVEMLGRKMDGGLEELRRVYRIIETRRVERLGKLILDEKIAEKIVAKYRQASEGLC